MEEILASIKKVIAEDKEVAWASLAGSDGRRPDRDHEERRRGDVLELNDELAPAGGSRAAPDRRGSGRRQPQRARAAQHGRRKRPRTPPPANPLEDMIREMLRPMLKQWLDDHLPRLVDEHVKREISRITGRPL